MSHWATQYIGLPWSFGATGPDAFDCWGFVQEVQRKHFGVELPGVNLGREPDWRLAALELERNEEHVNWVPVEQPKDGDLVLMARARLPVHIGLWCTANGTLGVLHCLEGAGVLYQRANALQAGGWGRLLHYRHKSKCTS